MHKSKFQRIHLAERKELIGVGNNKIFKMGKELMKVKNAYTQKKDATKLENNKLKESLRLLKILPKE